MDLIEESRQRRGPIMLALPVRDEGHGPFDNRNSSRATKTYRRKTFYSISRESRPADEDIQAGKGEAACSQGRHTTTGRWRVQSTYKPWLREPSE